MRKMRISILVLLIIASIAYSSVWFFSATAIKNNILASLKHFKEERKFDIAYESVSLGGFPYHIKVTFKKPVITLYKSAVELLSMNMPTLTIASDLLGKQYEILESNDIQFSVNKKIYSLNYNAPPTIKVEFNHSPLFSKLKAGEEYKWWNNVNAIDYSDKGYKIFDRANQPVYASSHTGFKVKHNISPTSNTVDGNIIFKDFVCLTKGKVIKFDFDTGMGVEIIHNENKEDIAPYDLIKLSLKNYNLIAENFTVKASGEFQSSKEEFTPLGKLNIDISNYNNLLEQLYIILNIENQEKFANLLTEKIATVNGDNLSFSIERKSGGMLQVGNITMPEILAYFLGANNQ
ncbi:hypothetical protein NOVO_05120 [Rickettsiales bacterium Ac37b]|nr:hypothetical protein NOVO_05120 [Rickettsiales bacterium Ac37b]